MRLAVSGRREERPAGRLLHQRAEHADPAGQWTPTGQAEEHSHVVGVVKEPSQVAANQLTVRMCFFLSETPNVHHLIKRPAVHANADCLLVETILSKEKPHRYITSQEQIMAMGVFKIHIYIYT